MVATLFLLGSLLAPAQGTGKPAAAPTGESAGWMLAPKLSRAQELVYRGVYNEESNGGSVQFTRSYRLENRLFVLDAPARGTEVAFLTLLRTRENRAQSTGFSTPPPPQARVEKATIDIRGRMTTEPAGVLAVPLDGPPTCECGAIVELPSGRVAVGQGWEIAEPGRPLHLWRIAASESINGSNCLKLTGVQQSDDWDRPRADRAAWRRLDTVWLSPRTGVAVKVERVIERREPARREATMRSTLRYELESTLQYPHQFYEDRKQEIQQARAFSQAAQPYLASPVRHGPQLTALTSKINLHLERHPPTPYREAVLQVQRQVEAGKRGEALVQLVGNDAPTPKTGCELGQVAPDFVVPYMTHSGPSFQLHRWLGRPIILVFYHPASSTSPDMLRFVQETADRSGSQIAAFALSVDTDALRVRKQWSELGLKLPAINGSGLRKSYAVETTPKIVVLDARGVVRGAYMGWGRETPAEVQRDLRECLKK